MKTSWTKGLEPEQEKDVRGSFKEALVMRNRLKDIISDKMKSSWECSFSKNAYDNPNWSLQQADARGYERALKEVYELLKD